MEKAFMKEHIGKDGPGLGYKVGNGRRHHQIGQHLPIYPFRSSQGEKNTQNHKNKIQQDINSHNFVKAIILMVERVL